MDEKLVGDIVLAAAREVMFDADTRYAAWLAAQGGTTRAADLAGAGIDLSADIFAALTTLVEAVWNHRVELGTGFVSGALANFATDLVQKRAPTLTKIEQELIAASVAKGVEAAFQAGIGPDQGPKGGPPTEQSEGT